MEKNASSINSKALIASRVKPMSYSPGIVFLGIKHDNLYLQLFHEFKTGSLLSFWWKVA